MGAVWHTAGWFSLMTMAVTALWWKLDSPCKFTSLEGTSGSFSGCTPEHEAIGRSWICHACHLPLSASADVGEGLILYSLRNHRGCLISTADVISIHENQEKSPSKKTSISLCCFRTLLQSFSVALVADMVQFHICCNLMCLDHPLWNCLDRNMAPFNYLESWHMALEIVIRFLLILRFSE